MTTSTGKQENLSNLCGSHAVSTMHRYAEDEVRCIMGESPKMREVLKEYGGNSLDAWITEIVNVILRSGSIAADDLQLTIARDVIKGRYAGLKMAELLLFTNKFLSGEYEKFYKVFDIQVLTKSLNLFMSYRNGVISKNEIKKESKTRINGAQNFANYQSSLQKAIYGDKREQEYLGLSDNDMYHCVVMSVATHGWPLKMLDYLPDDYKKMYERIVAKMGCSTSKAKNGRITA